MKIFAKILLTMIVGVLLAGLLPGQVWAGSCLCQTQHCYEDSTGGSCDPEIKCINDRNYIDQNHCDSTAKKGSGLIFDDWNSCQFFSGRNCKEEETPVEADLVKDLKIGKPILGITIPGLNLTDVKREDLFVGQDGNVYMPLPWVSQYLAALYKFAMTAGSILAVVMIIVAGVQVTASAGGENKTKGYKRIGGAVIGLFILWGSYFVLSTINPDLVNFRALRVEWISPEDMPTDTSASVSDQDAQDAGFAVADQKDFIRISDLKIGNVKTTKTSIITSKEIGDKLKLVAEQFKKNLKVGDSTITISDGYRSPDEQYKLMMQNCNCPAKEKLPQTSITGGAKDWDAKAGCNTCVKCKASCSIQWDGTKLIGAQIGHLAGNAIDAAGGGESKVKCDGQSEKIIQSKRVVYYAQSANGPSGDNLCVPYNQQIFIKTMLDNGFCVGLASGMSITESWHFELIGGKITKKSPFCTNTLSDPNLQKLYYLQHPTEAP